MDEGIRRALAIDRSTTAQERTVDITTIGRRSGRPRRIEIWFHRVHGRWYLSSLPAKPGWYANLKANPRFTFHLKHGVRAYLAAPAAALVKAGRLAEARLDAELSPLGLSSARVRVLLHLVDAGGALPLKAAGSWYPRVRSGHPSRG